MRHSIIDSEHTSVERYIVPKDVESLHHQSYECVYSQSADVAIPLGTYNISIPPTLSLNSAFNSSTTSSSFYTMETMTNSTYEVDLRVSARVSSGFTASIGIASLATLTGNLQSNGVGLSFHYGYLINNIGGNVTVEPFETHALSTYKLSQLTQDINNILGLYSVPLTLLTSTAVQALGISLISPSIVNTVTSSNVDFMIQGISPSNSITAYADIVRVG
jgi:hypothetical protein